MRFKGAWTVVFAGALVAAACWGAACGSSNSSNSGQTGDGGLGDDGSSLPPFGNDSGHFNNGDGGVGTLTILPANATLNATGPTSTEQFTAMLVGSSAPLTGVSWTIDSPLVGSIAQNGLFTASGTIGGTINVSAQTASAQGTTTLTVKLLLVDNPGDLDGGTQGQLLAGETVDGGADPAFKWLYPYDKTVFPRGLTAPVLQFGGEAATATMVHVTSATIDYTAYYGGSTPANTVFSDAAWTSITESVGSGVPVTVAATKLSASGVSGPITETWSIATGSLKGTVYYNSYDSQLNNGSGAVLSIKPGQATPNIFAGGCTVCHAVSANGSTLVAMGGAAADTSNAYAEGLAVNLTVDGGATRVENDSYMGFGGLYPDGTLLLSEGAVAGGWPPNIPGLGDTIVSVPSGDRVSKLFDPRSGTALTATGFDGVVSHAFMPAFSPDGTKVVFNHFDVGQGQSLAVMDFARTGGDAGAATYTFSNLVDIVTLAAGEYASWPYFAPDSKTVFFHVDNTADYATWDEYNAATPRTGDLEAVDVATKTVTTLDSVNGVSGGNIYLPYGAAEAHLNYEPTLLPVAVGGYYWVVFTSRRDYGNTICPATGDTDPYESSPGKRKKLWVAAVDINITPGKDPTHPAFYLSGQELAAGNMRGFWVLDPCQQNGTSCNSGDQCCTGFCRESTAPDGGEVLSCVPQPVGCSNEFEKCNTTADCCGAATQGFQCIDGYCAQPPVK